MWDYARLIFWKHLNFLENIWLVLENIWILMNIYWEKLLAIHCLNINQDIFFENYFFVNVSCFTFFLIKIRQNIYIFYDNKIL